MLPMLSTLLNQPVEVVVSVARDKSLVGGASRFVHFRRGDGVVVGVVGVALGVAFGIRARAEAVGRVIGEGVGEVVVVHGAQRL